MSPFIVLLIISCYFGVILVISYFTGRQADNASFFIGRRQSPWYVVAIGMIGASLSGVTFISVPGWVRDSQFSYMQMVFGYLLGYFIIAHVLLPLYYRLKLTSIYTYLLGRFGNRSYKTGAGFFIVSRIIGAAFRLFLVSTVLHVTMFEAWNLPFWLTVVVTILLIWLYTYRGGIGTIIWTDLIQTFFMLAAVAVTIVLVASELDLDLQGIVGTIRSHEYSKMFFRKNWNGQQHFIKQFLAGAFIAVVMTGLDQDMMQKNLSCRNLKEARKNIYLMSLSLVPVNLLFLSLGVLLYVFAHVKQIPVPALSDELFPILATRGYLSPVVGLFFLLGLVAAAYSSADSALTALTTSVTVDIIGISGMDETRVRKIRIHVHMIVSLLLLLVILLFRAINDRSVISAIFTVAGYTYGPLLGLYSFGLFTRKKVYDRLVPVVALASPVICLFLNAWSEVLFGGYRFGFEMLIVNGFLTFMGLLIISKSGRED